MASPVQGRQATSPSELREADAEIAAAEMAAAAAAAGC